MYRPLRKSRIVEFIGDHQNHSIVIGDHGDLRVKVKGNFDLSGLIYCLRSSVEFTVEGEGTLSFRGACKQLILKNINGNCTLDLSNFYSELVWCESAKGKSRIILGNVKFIESVNLDEEASIQYTGNSPVLRYSIRGNSRMYCPSAELVEVR